MAAFVSKFWGAVQRVRGSAVGCFWEAANDILEADGLSFNILGSSAVSGKQGDLLPFGGSTVSGQQ